MIENGSGSSLCAVAPATGGLGAVSADAGCGTLVLDGLGNIRSCGTVARDMFGDSRADYAGLSISSLIGDLPLSNVSLSYSARYIAHLCDESGWKQFEAVDVCGHGFAVELRMSRLRATDGHDLFLLRLRRPGQSDACGLPQFQQGEPL